MEPVQKRMRAEQNPLLEPVRSCQVFSTLAEAGEGKKIGTHDGKFHCDEALACAMLKMLPEWADASVVRTRDAETLAGCDIVVDVGGVYDPETLRFDHHMKTFETALDGACTKVCSLNRPELTLHSSQALVWCTSTSEPS